MISADSQGGPNIALITIICGWTFLGIALLGVSLHIWARLVTLRRFGLDDCSTIIALAINVALVAQTTWAIVREGQDNHEAEVSSSKFELIVRVGASSLELFGWCIEMVNSRFWSTRLYGAWSTRWSGSALCY